MKNKILWMAAFTLLACLSSGWAADLAGSWIAKISGRQGIVETFFDFKVDGTVLTGTVSDPRGKTTISAGIINGDEISFFVIRNRNGREEKLKYKGKVSDDEIKFTRESGDRGQPQEFVAKREFLRNGDIPLQKTQRPIDPEGKQQIAPGR